MDHAAATVEVPSLRAPQAPAVRRRGLVVPAALTAAIAVGFAVRFATLGLQSYHHDEVITAMRVLPGGIGHLLHEVRASESNPPLYYVLAWGWAKAFGLGEVGLRSLSALFGVLLVPVGYLIGRQLASRRAGLLLAGFVAVNPMLVWYSQEARCYSLLVLCCSLSLLFFLRGLASRARGDLALWGLSSALALGTHYFALFPVAIEAAWLLWTMRRRLAPLLPGLVLPYVTGIALVPLLTAQTNPVHIGWIENSPLASRYLEAGVSFLIGETGHVIAEPPRHRYALVPAVLVAIALVLLLVRGSSRERRAAGVVAAIGLGTAALTLVAALLGHDYVVERNLLPALVPLAAAVAIGCATRRARVAGLVVALALCAYWLGFDAYVTRKPNLQRPDFRALAQAVGPARGSRALVGWKLAADPIRWYLPGKAPRMYGGRARVREVDVVSKPRRGGRGDLPPAFRFQARSRVDDRITVTRYASSRPLELSFAQLASLRTGYGRNGVVLNGPYGWRPGKEVRIRSGTGG